MNIYALQTARDGSKSVLNKNILEVKGKPLYLHNVLEAQKSKYIQNVYISTDIEYIKKRANTYKYKIINRPKELTGDDASHYDTILHGLNVIEEEVGEELDLLVVLLGNSIGANKDDLDQAIEMLLENDEAHSVQSVSEYTMYNPFRAFTKDSRYLETFLTQDYIKKNSELKNINDRNSAGKIYFFNGSFWIIKRDILIKKNGLLPFPWLGIKILPYVQKNYMEVDDYWQLEYLKKMDF